MLKCLIVFTISVFFFVAATALRQSSNKNKRDRNTYAKTSGTIDKVAYSENGNKRYYVSFYVGDNKYIAKTDYYLTSKKILSVGDRVDIGYCFIDNTPFAVIYDNELTPCAKSVPSLYTFLFFIGGGLLLISLFMFIFYIG